MFFCPSEEETEETDSQELNPKEIFLHLSYTSFQTSPSKYF